MLKVVKQAVSGHGPQGFGKPGPYRPGAPREAVLGGGWSLPSRPFCGRLETTVAEGGLTSPQAMAWQRGKASPLEGSFHSLLCVTAGGGRAEDGGGSVRIWGLGFGKPQAVLLGHAVVFAGKKKTDGLH